jgi:hypothetical protein
MHILNNCDLRKVNQTTPWKEREGGVLSYSSMRLITVHWNCGWLVCPPLCTSRRTRPGKSWIPTVPSTCSPISDTHYNFHATSLSIVWIEWLHSPSARWQSPVVALVSVTVKNGFFSWAGLFSVQEQHSGGCVRTSQACLEQRLLTGLAWMDTIQLSPALLSWASVTDHSLAKIPSIYS